jgi:hypothetical protein
MKTKNVYVYGNVYYDADSGVEIQIFFDDSIVFAVPEEMDLEEPSDELHNQIQANAEGRLREKLGNKIVLKKNCWDADYVVHNVEE